jgi:hypothetical protein
MWRVDLYVFCSETLPLTDLMAFLDDVNYAGLSGAGPSRASTADTSSRKDLRS